MSFESDIRRFIDAKLEEHCILVCERLDGLVSKQDELKRLLIESRPCAERFREKPVADQNDGNGAAIPGLLPDDPDIESVATCDDISCSRGAAYSVKSSLARKRTTQTPSETFSRSSSTSLAPPDAWAEFCDEPDTFTSAVSLTLWKLEGFCAILIAVDIALITCQLQFFAFEDTLWYVVRVCDAIVCAGFVLELSFRFYFLRWEMLTGLNRWWNLLDLLIVFITVNEVFINWLEARNPSHFAQLSMLRVFRLFRIVRALRFLQEWNFCRELRMLMKAAHRVGRSLIWVSMLAITFHYACSIALVIGVMSNCRESVETDTDVAQLCLDFGSLSRSMWSLLKSVYGGILWSDLARVLSSVHPAYAAIIFLHVILTKYVIIGMAYGTIMTIIQQNSARDLADIIHDEIDERRTCTQYLHDVFDMMDVNKTGSVSSTEFDLAMRNERIASFFRAFKLGGVLDWKQLFSLIDDRGFGAVDRHVFINRFFCLRGEARTVDLLALHQSTHRNGPREDSQKHIQKQPTCNSETTLAFKHISTCASDRHSFVHLPLLRNAGGKAKCRIRKVEERAMSLSELLDIHDMILNRIKGRGWEDLVSYELLKPEVVNLYHLNYYVIAPFTAVKHVILKGIKAVGDLLGCIIEQSSSVLATPLAVGRVLQNHSDGTIKVELLYGRFVSGMVVRKSEAANSDAELVEEDCDRVDKDLGVPSKVEAPDACSYKELVSEGPLKPRWFCSHWWGEPVMTFVMCLNEHARLRHLRTTSASYWICAYANCQHHLDEELSEDPESSSFGKAMRCAEGTLLVLDSAATPFKRIWCDFELFKTVTLQRPLDIITECGGKPQLLSDQFAMIPNESMLAKTLREQNFPIKLIFTGLNTQLQDGSASAEIDKERILKSMQKSGISVDVANGQLHGFLARAVWPQAIRHGKVENFGLPDFLVRDTKRKKLQISLAHFGEVGDRDIHMLAKGIPATIECIRFSFSECQKLSDHGMGHLARRLKELVSLQELVLDFVGCVHVSDSGLETLAMSLPTGLQHLELHFDLCSSISNHGIVTLADHITQVKRFSGTFRGTRVDKDFSTKAEVLAYSKSQGGNKDTRKSQTLQPILRRHTTIQQDTTVISPNTSSPQATGCVCD